MNTASRMESNSLANRINLSEAAYKALQEQAPSVRMTSRGKLEIKGKGPMEARSPPERLPPYGEHGFLCQPYPSPLPALPRP